MRGQYHKEETMPTAMMFSGKTRVQGEMLNRAAALAWESPLGMSSPHG